LHHALVADRSSAVDRFFSFTDKSTKADSVMVFRSLLSKLVPLMADAALHNIVVDVLSKVSGNLFALGEQSR
jgi:hypothetical protein